MAHFFLERERVAAFVTHLMARKPVFAPRRRGRKSYAFARIDDPATVVLDYPRTLHSVKKFFMPPREELLSFDLTENTCEAGAVAPVDGIFLGVHAYDLAAVHRLDYNFSQGNAERNYLERRKGAVFVGVSFEPDNFHFSGSVGIEPDDDTGFDVFLDRRDDGYEVRVLTPAGEALAEGFAFGEREPVRRPATAFQQHIYLPQARLGEVMAASWNHPVWAETAQACVGCGTCNLVCPTCYCFDVDDSVDITATKGARARSWDGCMLTGFSGVAGGEVFREGLDDRQRHRVFRKFKYISDETGEPWCVGCGRCTASCAAGISIANIVNRLVGDSERTVVAPV